MADINGSKEETDKKTVVIKEEANDSAQEQGLAKSLSL